MVEHARRSDSSQGQGVVLSISIVSHGQLELVQRLLRSLEAHRPQVPLRILVTENRKRDRLVLDHRTDLDVELTINPRRRGLAGNINSAFHLAMGKQRGAPDSDMPAPAGPSGGSPSRDIHPASGDAAAGYFCVLNPDVVFVEDVFTPLIEDIRRGEGDIVAPRVEDRTGRIQDSARPLPSPWTILGRRFTRSPGTLANLGDLPARPDWIAGLFLLMPSVLFRELGGMDEGYFLYFEDVDFCLRARLRGYRLFVDRDLRVVHQARRASRRNPQYLGQHVASAVRFFSSPVYREAHRLPSASQE